MLAGLGIAGAAFGARFLMHSFKQFQKHASKLPKSPLFTAYYKGGFDPKMSRREAGLILGKKKEVWYETWSPVFLASFPGHTPYSHVAWEWARDCSVANFRIWEFRFQKTNTLKHARNVQHHWFGNLSFPPKNRIWTKGHHWTSNLETDMLWQALNSESTGIGLFSGNEYPAHNQGYC